MLGFSPTASTPISAVPETKVIFVKKIPLQFGGTLVTTAGTKQIPIEIGGTIVSTIHIPVEIIKEKTADIPLKWVLTGRGSQWTLEGRDKKWTLNYQTGKWVLNNQDTTWTLSPKTSKWHIN